MIIIFIYVIEVNSIPLLIKYKNKTKTIKIIQDVQSLKWKKKVINFLREPLTSTPEVTQAKRLNLFFFKNRNVFLQSSFFKKFHGKRWALKLYLRIHVMNSFLKSNHFSQQSKPRFLGLNQFKDLGGGGIGGKVGGTAVGGKVGVTGIGGRGGFSDRRSSKRRESMRVRIDALNLFSRFFISISIVLILKTFNTSDVRLVQFCS